MANENWPTESTVFKLVFQLPTESDSTEDLLPHEVFIFMTSFGEDVPQIETVVSLCMTIPSEKRAGTHKSTSL